MIIQYLRMSWFDLLTKNGSENIAKIQIDRRDIFIRKDCWRSLNLSPSHQWLGYDR